MGGTGLIIQQGLTVRRGVLGRPFRGSLWFLLLRTTGNLSTIGAPDAQTRYWASGDNTPDLPAKSLSERSPVRAPIRAGDLSFGNPATILPTYAVSKTLIKNDKSVVPVAGIECTV